MDLLYDLSVMMQSCYWTVHLICGCDEQINGLGRCQLSIDMETLLSDSCVIIYKNNQAFYELMIPIEYCHVMGFGAGL